MSAVTGITLEDIEKVVAKMRELGVTEMPVPWSPHPIRLGPDPKATQGQDRQLNEAERAERAAIAHRDTMFAACNIKPRLNLAKGAK